MEETSQMGLLQFGLLCIDFLAWPILALAYPLCASIRAIETGSKYHMRKLVTYWTVLSIVSLFEHTLRVMEWVPLWPYIKLVGTFWLVVPRFNGACYAYDCLVNADLGAKLPCILSQFTRALYAQKQLSIDIKAMEQTTEQGTEETKSKDFKSMEQTTEQGITEERKVKSAVDNIGQMQKQETEAPWVKGIPVANDAEEKIIPEINSSKLIQREWTCAVCQVTTTSENNLKLHLGGKRHRTNCAELKPSKQVTKDPGSSSPKATDLPNQAKNEPAKHAPAGGGSKQETDVTPEKVQENASSVEESTVSVSEDPRPYCSICNTWFSSEAEVMSHLKGRKHLSKLKQMGILMVNEPANHTPAGGGSKQETNVKPEKATGLQNQAKNEPTKPNAPTEGGSNQKTNASVSTDSKPYCSFCNIWPPCEAALVAHLKGRKHLSKLKQMGIMIANEPAKPGKETGLQNQVKNEPAMHAPAGGGSKQETDVKPEKATGLPNQVKNESAKHAPTEGEWKQKTSGKQEKVQVIASGIEESTVSVSADPRPYCSICDMWCSREADVVSHLKGRRHLSKLKQMGILMVNEPTNHTPAEVGSKQESNVKPEKATGLPNQPKTEPAELAPTEGKSKQKTSGEQAKVQANASGEEECTVSVSEDPRPYCSICYIWFSGEADMVSHLKGRKHLSKLKQMGILMVNEPANHTPAGGSQQETNVKPEKETGLQNQVKNEPAKPNASAEGGSKQKTDASVSTDSKPYCTFCNIWPPCEAALVSHLNGRKHLSKLKQMGIMIAKPEKETGLQNQVKNEPAKPNASAEGGSKQKTDASVSTDSKPYCTFCNIWPPCEAALVSHLNGRKHLSKLKQMGIMIAKPEKETGLQNQVKNEPAKPNASAEGGSKQKTDASVSTDSKPYCTFCNIWPPCEAALVAHLKGRKHLSKLKQMGILKV